MASAVALTSWKHFEEFLDPYFALEPQQRRQFLFRGQARESWTLNPTLDRKITGAPAADRKRRLTQFINEFKMQSIGFGGPLGTPADALAWELLGRHHGLPTTILDWTFSPYVAAFFAFSDPAPTDEPVAIFTFDRRYFAGLTGDGPVEVIESYEHMWFNVRAVEQAAVTMKVHSMDRPLEEALGDHLAILTIPRSERPNALTRLNAMRITDRNLFRDMDHAARTAEWLGEAMR